MKRITSVGGRVKYKAFDTLAAAQASRPTSGYTYLEGVTATPDFQNTIDALDTTQLSDYAEQFGRGLERYGGDKSFTLLQADEVITAWNTNLAGKFVWFEETYPDANMSFFYMGYCAYIGKNGSSVNSTNNVTGSFTAYAQGVWAAKSTVMLGAIGAGTAAANLSMSIAVGATSGNTITLSNPSGTVSVTTSNAEVATAAASGTGTITVTVSAIAAGTARIVITDANLDRVECYVTVTAAA